MNEQDVALVVAEREYAQRLDVFVAQRLPWRSRRSLVELLRGGRITVNGAPAKKAQRLLVGDRVQLRLPAAPPDASLAELELAILFEDDDLVVVDKPANLTVHPASTCMDRNLLRRLQLRYRDECPDPRVEPAVVHRLDRGTSGVIAFAKRRELVAYYAAQFERRTTAKAYVAMVHGVPPECGDIRHPILAPPGRPVRIDPSGKPSHTTYRRLRHCALAAWVHVDLHTGRKHQIRVHLAAAGHPLVYDDVYGGPAEPHRPADACPMLHAARLTLDHRTRGRMTFEAPVPARFEQAWSTLAASP